VEHRLRVLGNRVLRKMFGPKREEDGSWRKLHKDELHNLYSLLNIFRLVKSRRMMWEGHLARMGEGRGVYRILVARPKSKRPLGRPRRKWKDNIKMDLREIGIDGANWIRLAQDSVQWRACANTVMNLGVP
jgi:transcription termination factor 2